jgi:predicted nucleic acid-binding protein
MAIASCLVDTNILLRIARRSDPHHKAVDTALARLAEQGTILHYTFQNIAELWNVMTRPVTNNGRAYPLLKLSGKYARSRLACFFWLTALWFTRNGGGL